LIFRGEEAEPLKRHSQVEPGNEGRERGKGGATLVTRLLPGNAVLGAAASLSSQEAEPRFPVRRQSLEKGIPR